MSFARREFTNLDHLHADKGVKLTLEVFRQLTVVHEVHANLVGEALRCYARFCELLLLD